MASLYLLILKPMLKKILLSLFLGIVGVAMLLLLGIFILIKIPLPEELQQKSTSETLVLKDVHIIDLENDTILQNQAILIEDGRIQGIGSIDFIQIKEDAEIIDTKGKYVIPALWDMHAHLISSQAPQLNLPLFIAAGVTHIRDLGGGTDNEVKTEWQKDIAAGKLLGPRIASRAAFVINYLEDEEEAVKRVNEVEDKKDFIKTYNAILPGPFNKMAEEARKNGVSFLGHKPRSVPAIVASKQGMKSFEHARVFLYDCFPGAADVQEEYRARISGEKQGKGPIVSREIMQSMVNNHDPEMFAELVEVMKANNTWYVPTHITRKMDAYADDKDYLNDPRLKYISMGQTFAWKQDTKGMVESDPSEAGRKAYMDFYKKGLELSKKAYDMGLPILLGTDANDTYCFPGLGIHDELEALVAGGLTPREALLTGTRNPAQYYGWEADYGSVSLGKVADLILLDENPLEDITHTSKIQSVVFQGVLYDRSELDEMLNYVKENAASLNLNAKLIYEKVIE